MTREVAVVTGGGSGIGRGIAHALARRGAYVAVMDLSAEAAGAVLGELGHGTAGCALQVDVGNLESVAAAVQQVIDRTGRLDTVVANAGIATPGRVDRIAVEAWTRAVAVNLNGVFHMARETIPHLRQSDRACFVAVSSDAGLRGAHGWPAYAATKHAVIGLVKSMAADHGPEGIRVNAVCPGWVRTPLMDGVVDETELADLRDSIPLGRFAEPEDVANVVLHLASPQARHTHGMAYLMDGGESAAVYRRAQAGA